MPHTTTTRPERLGPYVLEEELGRGAFGVVYRAHHPDRPDVPLALKVVENRGNLDRLMLEPALLSRLKHPNIVRLEDYFLDGDRLVLALEYVPGKDLKAELDHGMVLDEAAIQTLLVQLAGALAEAHAQNIIHRDLKLSNILVDRREESVRFVLTDFGIGQTAEGIQVRKRTGGTYAFMAPEQLQGRPGPQSDLWALGVVAYRLLTGKMPFTGQTLPELSTQICYHAPVPPSKVSDRPVDAKLETVVFHLLEKSLTARTASARDLLQEFGEADPGSKLPRRAGAASTLPTGRAELDQKIARRVRRHRILVGLFVTLFLLWKGVIAGAVLAAAVLLFFLAQHPRPRTGRLPPWAAIGLALVLMGGSTLLRQTEWDYDLGSAAAGWIVADVGGVQWDDPALAFEIFRLVWIVFLASLLLIGFLAPVAAAYYYAKLREDQRAQALRRAILEVGDNPDRYLATMKAFLDYRFEDVGFHLRYTEALLARGRLDEVVVEARLLLLQDPYNFNGNLILANAYHALGLHNEGIAVCDKYLALAGYCFEFSELKEQCLRKGAAA